MSVEPNPYDSSGVPARPQSDEPRFGIRYAPILLVSLSNCFLQLLEPFGDEGMGIIVGYFLGQTSIISLWVAWGTGSFRRRVWLATLAGACLSLGAWLPNLLAEGVTALAVDGTQALAYIIAPLCCVCITTSGLIVLRRCGNWRLTKGDAAKGSDPERPNLIHFFCTECLCRSAVLPLVSESGRVRGVRILRLHGSQLIRPFALVIVVLVLWDIDSAS